MRASDIPPNLIDLAEHPVPANVLRQHCAAFPQAAQVALDLLRRIDLSDAKAGIAQESLAYAQLQSGAEHAKWLAGRTQSKSTPGRVDTTRTGNVIDILLNRPKARNAVDCVMRDALCEAFTVAALDPDVSRVNLHGAGKAFCMGGDLEEFGTTRDPAAAHTIRMQTLPALAILQCAHKFEAHVQGACVGSGLEMAAFAARLTATPDAWFQLPELAMGLIPGAGGCVSVTRRIGRRRAALMILSGKRISARTALGWGLIDAIVEDATAADRHADVAR